MDTWNQRFNGDDKPAHEGQGEFAAPVIAELRALQRRKDLATGEQLGKEIDTDTLCRRKTMNNPTIFGKRAQFWI